MPPPAPRIEILMMATPNLDYYARMTTADWRRYCDQHGYGFHLYRERLIDDMHINWSCIEMVCQRLEQTDADWLISVDADTLVARKDVTIESLLGKHPGKDLVFASDILRPLGIAIPNHFPSAWKFRTRFLPNGGFVMVRNNAFSYDFHRQWIDLARGKLAHLADRHPRNQSVLWHGLYFQHQSRIGLLGDEVVRCGTNDFIDRISFNKKKVFVLHDKKLTL